MQTSGQSSATQLHNNNKRINGKKNPVLALNKISTCFDLLAEKKTTEGKTKIDGKNMEQYKNVHNSYRRCAIEEKSPPIGSAVE